MDYSIRGDLQQMVFRICQNIRNIDHMKQVLNSCWDMIIQELIQRCY